MKLHNRLMLSVMAILALAGALTSCDNDFDYPPVIVPVADMEANTTIAEVKARYWDDARNYIDTIGVTTAGEHVIIAGRVIANDETGNIYKNIIIQDETAALTISINQKDLYENYKVGMEVVIDLTDMYIGKYNGLQQLGYPEWYAAGNSWEATFMEYDFFTAHTQINGLPRLDLLNTYDITIPEINAISGAEGLQRWQSQLVRLENVRWADGGLAPFSDAGGSTNRQLVDADGNTITVRNSNYSTFASEILPKGTGTVVAILSYYGTGWQLLLRDTSDLTGFEWVEGGDKPGEGETPAEANITMAELKALFWQDINNYAVEVGQNDKGEDYIIEATVISDDQSGNIYKYVYIADETGAAAVSLNDNAIYKTLPYGQKVLVNLTGLHVGKYAGLFSIGASEPYQDGTEVGRMSTSVFMSHVSKVGSAQPSAVRPIDASIATIAAIGKTDTQGLINWQGRLVKLQGVHFENGGTQNFVEGGQNTNQKLLDPSGASIVVRTSSYASFKDEQLPAGTGEVVGILSYYNGTWQLMLNNADGCYNFRDNAGLPARRYFNNIFNK